MDWRVPRLRSCLCEAPSKHAHKHMCAINWQLRMKAPELQCKHSTQLVIRMLNAPKRVPSSLIPIVLQISERNNPQLWPMIMGEARSIMFEVVFPNRLIMIHDKRSLPVKITRNQQISIQFAKSHSIDDSKSLARLTRSRTRF